MHRISVLLLICSVLLPCFCSAHGEDSLNLHKTDSSQISRSRYDLGIIGGPSSNILSGNSFISKYDSPILSFGAGLSFQYNFKKTVSLCMGFGYIKKGSYATATYDYDGSLKEGIRMRRGFSYFEIPLLLRFCIGHQQRYFLDLGGYSSRLISQNDIETSVFGRTYGQENSAVYSSKDYGLIAGGGIQWMMKDKNSLCIGLRAEVGLKDLALNTVFTGGPTYTETAMLFIAYVTHFGQR